MVRSRGITLVECLVVLVVAVVVAAVLFPVYSSDGRNEPRNRCLSQIKQLGMSGIMYADDYDDRLPDAGAWMDRFIPYAKNEELFHDPLDVQKGDYGYGFRERASQAHVSSFKEPKSTVLIFDSTLIGRNAHSELWSMPEIGRHKSLRGNGAFDNAAFVDGHARSFRTDVDAAVPGASSALKDMLAADDKATQP